MIAIFKILLKVNHNNFPVTSYFFYSKCNSQWENCIGPDEKHLREQADYFEKYFGDTCPSYNPDAKSDPYPGQPFLEDLKQPKPNIYHQNAYIYNLPRPYIHSDNRRVGEDLKAAACLKKARNCRKWTQNGDGVVCDQHIECKGITLEELQEERDKLGPKTCNPDLTGRCEDLE